MRISERVDALISTGMPMGEAIARAVSEKPMQEQHWHTAADGQMTLKTQNG